MNNHNPAGLYLEGKKVKGMAKVIITLVDILMLHNLSHIVSTVVFEFF